jgi:NADH-quinone oxidoreductase subunit L
MEGPTPVSSLLHSATLVMAGLFAFYNFGQFGNSLIQVFAVASFLCVAILGRSEKDVKRTIAISTVIMVSFL